MKAADVNGDGHIDYSEFITATYKKDLLLSTENLRGAFEIFDVDGHGFICKEEIKQVFGDKQISKKGEWIWDQIMQEVDADNDGLITFEEFEDAMRTVVSQQQESSLSPPSTPS